jgi:pimeloyl-ACP methyl ester carboxylesterase
LSRAAAKFIGNSDCGMRTWKRIDETFDRVLNFAIRNLYFRQMAKNRKIERRRFQRAISHLSLVIVFCLLFASCGARRTPDLARIFAPAREQKNKRPIIVIPGILGSELINKQTKAVVWYARNNSIGDGISLPISPDLAANRDDLIAGKIIDSVHVAPFNFDVYNELIAALKDYGNYHEGNWEEPSSDDDHDTFYIFPYDWRRDNVETARELIHRIDELKAKLHRPDLRFNILAHSMGGLIARYAAMYGDADLPADGKPPQLTWAGARDINKIFMFGTPNEGSMEAFSTLLDGYSVTEGLRRRIYFVKSLSRENVFTIPALFELLPHKHFAQFLDENLNPVTVDLYDAATWKKYNWGAIASETYRARFAARRIASASENAAPNSVARGIALNDSSPAAETAHPAHTPTLEDLEGYFTAVLRRAKLYHQALDIELDDGRAPVAIYAFGGDCEETLSAPVIIRDPKTGGYLTLTQPRPFRNSAGKRITRGDLIKAMYEPGDGRVTRRSMLGGGSFRGDLPFVYTVFVCGIHSELQNNKTLQDNALTQLIGEVMR